ncbi:hypothetical protein AiwAL_06525 [Acidiphilium sp. AL]|uniref:Anti-sigma-28 factor FlgM C-terminal domain-containing protein n=1 Tax=Acidiphilium iwatense TaxID=768198 RepID=A0ABS9DW27_9PROT|nr:MULTISPECIES: hypothetical protein [Acidiphilium]MCF3946936.1 hypothetical protein [Acidiphilium iwatense]MCU4159759.1 hypothetical protein [Acidiphilium sp. AL]
MTEFMQIQSPAEPNDAAPPASPPDRATLSARRLGELARLIRKRIVEGRFAPDERDRFDDLVTAELDAGRAASAIPI